VETAVATTDYGAIGRMRMSLNLIDLTRALSVRRAVDRALRTVDPAAIIYGTGSAGYFEPAGRLSQAAIRFDSLAVDNRRGARHIVQRRLERRMIGHAGLLLPFASAEVWPPLVRSHRRRPLVLPTPVEPSRALTADRQPLAVCYAGAPEKKGLGLMLGAWAQARLPPPHELVVTGLDEHAGRRWLARQGLAEPPRVRWAGRLSPDDYRRLVAGAELYLAASRYEDYGIAQLEALADGALLVTTASDGPYQALSLARGLAPGLVADEATVPALARALRAAHALPAPDRDAYRRRAAEALAPLSRAAFRARLATEVLPLLVGKPGRWDQRAVRPREAVIA
jgi:glycosyltransferase involved in cell wall biosynthesis